MTEYIYHYLPVNNQAMEWGIFMTGAGRGVIPPGNNYPPPGHPALYQFAWHQGRTLPEFQVILITEGRGAFESPRSVKTPVIPNSTIVLFPGVWHRYRPDPKTGWTERWISLNGAIVQRLAHLGFITPRKAVWTVQHPQRLIQRFDQLLNHIHMHPSQNSILLSLHALDLLAEAIESSDDKSLLSNTKEELEFDPIDDPLVARAMEMIWTHSHRDLSVNQIARQLPITRRTLDRRFRAALGRTILEEIYNCRISRAKQLLKETILPVKTIAYLAGFANTERMRLAFRQKEKMSPLQYRRSPTT